MPVQSEIVYQEIKTHLNKLTSDRINKKQSLSFSGAKEGMLLLHIEWQDLITAVRKHDINRHAALAALHLAAAAIKFAIDLGDPKEMRLLIPEIETVSDDNETEHSSNSPLEIIRIGSE